MDKDRLQLKALNYKCPGRNREKLDTITGRTDLHISGEKKKNNFL